MISTSSTITRIRGEPRSCCQAWLPTVVGTAEALLCVEFELPQYWLPGSPGITLNALYLWRDGALEFAVAEGAPGEAGTGAGQSFDHWVRQNRLFVARDGKAIPLQARAIPKPWGRELWYTGVEQRGVCYFGDARRVPQPWLLAALPGKHLSPGEPLLLLKVLDPAPEPVTGDLYFELHGEKQEVYVVTGIDPQAWPDGVGYLRYGFDPQRVAAYADEAGFRADYLAAVEAYREVRETIDATTAGEPPAGELQQREANLRRGMDAFTFLKPVTRGEVVRVPRLLPHALQHGVRVVEFQTPVYERKILSFAQRVLTQSHWDTREAVQEMLLLPPVEAPPEIAEPCPGCRVEELCLFPGFEVHRFTLQGGAKVPLSVTADYALLMVTGAEIQVDGMGLGPEQAAFLPGGWQAVLETPQAAPPLVFLLAQPRD